MTRLALLSAFLLAQSRPPEMLTLMLKKGEALVDEPFTPETWGAKDWSKYKGKFELLDGALRVAEVPSDNHHPAASRKAALDSAVVQLRFKLDGAGWLGFAFDGKEHVARCLVRPDGFRVAKVTGIEPTTRTETVDERKVKFEPGRWYTLQIEIHGREMLANVDNTHFAFGEMEGIDTPKTRFELISGGQHAWFDDLKIWSAEPDPKWPQKKAMLAARTKKKS